MKEFVALRTFHSLTLKFKDPTQLIWNPDNGQSATKNKWNFIFIVY